MTRLVSYLPIALLVCFNILARMQPESWIVGALVGAMCGGGSVFVAALMDARDAGKRLRALRGVR